MLIYFIYLIHTVIHLLILLVLNKHYSIYLVIFFRLIIFLNKSFNFLLIVQSFRNYFKHNFIKIDELLNFYYLFYKLIYNIFPYLLLLFKDNYYLVYNLIVNFSFKCFILKI